MRRVEPLMGEHLELLLGDYRRALGQNGLSRGGVGAVSTQWTFTLAVS